MTTAVRWISGITAALVLLQATLIGQALYVNGMTTVALHGWLGSGSFAAAIILAMLTLVAVRRKEVSRLTLGLGLVVVLLMIAQLGLGYMGRRSGQAAALHVPNGVLITGLTPRHEFLDTCLQSGMAVIMSFSRMPSAQWPLGHA